MNDTIETKKEKNEGNVKVGFAANDFPLSNFIEWDLDCKQHFGDCRWLKLWNDHMISKSVGLHSLMVEKIENLEKEIELLKNKPKIKKKKKEEEYVDTIGGRLK
jgi:hypothetical protein